MCANFGGRFDSMIRFDSIRFDSLMCANKQDVLIFQDSKPPPPTDRICSGLYRERHRKTDLIIAIGRSEQLIVVRGHPLIRAT